MTIPEFCKIHKLNPRTKVKTGDGHEMLLTKILAKYGHEMYKFGFNEGGARAWERKRKPKTNKQ